MPITVTGLYTYPVKSCRGIAMEEASLTPYGFSHDRQWMVVDNKGHFLTQRRFPIMALVAAVPDGDGLRLQAPRMAELTVPSPRDRPLSVRVWGFEGTALDAGDEAAAWFSELLGLSCRLAMATPTLQRPIDNDDSHYSGEVMFADGFPFLLISEPSLRHLNHKLALPVSMNRFRPNIVVDGCDPHAEDDWKQLRIGEVLLQVAKPCSRCTVPQVDQATGVRGEEPSRTLATYRVAEDGEIYFGQNLIHETQQGVIRVGDTVEILA